MDAVKGMGTKGTVVLEKSIFEMTRLCSQVEPTSRVLRLSIIHIQ